jgi:hypothetical protein
VNLETNKAIARGYLHELVNMGNLGAFDTISPKMSRSHERNP